MFASFTPSFASCGLLWGTACDGGMGNDGAAVRLAQQANALGFVGTILCSRTARCVGKRFFSCLLVSEHVVAEAGEADDHNYDSNNMEDLKVHGIEVVAEHDHQNDLDKARNRRVDAACRPNKGIVADVVRLRPPPKHIPGAERRRADTAAWVGRSTRRI